MIVRTDALTAPDRQRAGFGVKLLYGYPLSKARVTAIRTALRERDAVHPRGAVQP